ncbi:MAG: hypothetical protein JXA00_01795 [Candidatus Thermoplasmatota archaeon]|nr:hypothetical protein [Candidatus Thermoplasmatota archaeon]
MKRAAVAIIILFIGGMVAPSITHSGATASDDRGSVEITVTAYGIRGIGDTSVHLSHQQYQGLQQYLGQFRERLNQTTTRQEAVPVFKEAVVELNEYGLLPKEMSVAQAQRLVTGQTLPTALATQLLERTPVAFGENENVVCLLAGSLTGTMPHNPLDMMMNRVFWVLASVYLHHPKPLVEHVLNIAFLGYMGSFFLSALLFYGIPVHLFLTIGVGYTAFAAYIPSYGQLITVGLNGVKH